MKTEERIKVLKQVSFSPVPVGASSLCCQLHLPQARVGRILLALERDGYLVKVSNKGRLITPQGLDYLNQQENRSDKLACAQFIIDTAASGSYHQLCEVLDIRRSLESLSVRQACVCPSPPLLHQLEQILDEQKANMEQGGAGSEQDLQFHLKIAELSQNSTLVHLLKLLLTQEDAYTQFSAAAPHLIDRQIKQHADIVSAIRNQDADQAQEAMQHHLSQVLDDVQKYYQKKAGSK